MTYEDKVKLVDLARQMMTASIRENGIDETILQLIHPNAKSNKDYSGEELCIIMWVDGYLRCKKENRNIIENMKNEGKPASEIFSRLVGEDYVHDRG